MVSFFIAGDVVVAGVSCGAQNSFMGWFSLEESQSLKEWARVVRARRGELGFMLPEPEVSRNFRSGLGFLLRFQWECLEIHHRGEVQFELLHALVHGYISLTSYNWQQFQQTFSSLSAAKRREQLECLAKSGEVFFME